MSSSANGSSGDVAISVRGLSKAYTITHEGDRPSTLAETVLRRVRHPFQRAASETFWALHDLSFDIRRGEVVGVIGRNGAGKSTLLKILSRITEPTRGEVDLFGRVGSLLEVGTGFHPELTGRENIFLNGAILGMAKSEIRAQFDAIVDFAGVEQFLDTPVKRYSSGMYVRLAFAVAAHLNPEILIVDEVLAVGDAEFQKKCLGKMKDVSSQGRTVLFVSHNMSAVRALCHTGILLKGGQMLMQGPAQNAITEYLRAATDAAGCSAESDYLRLSEVRISQADMASTNTVIFNTAAEIHLHLEAKRTLDNLAIVVHLRDANDVHVASMCSPEEGHLPFDLRAGKCVAIRCRLDPVRLMPGRYSLSVYAFRPYDPVAYLSAERVRDFEVAPAVLPGGMWPYGVENRQHGLLRLADTVEMEL